MKHPLCVGGLLRPGPDFQTTGALFCDRHRHGHPEDLEATGVVVMQLPRPGTMDARLFGWIIAPEMMQKAAKMEFREATQAPQASRDVWINGILPADARSVPGPATTLNWIVPQMPRDANAASLLIAPNIYWELGESLVVKVGTLTARFHYTDVISSRPLDHANPMMGARSHHEAFLPSTGLIQENDRLSLSNPSPVVFSFTRNAADKNPNVFSSLDTLKQAIDRTSGFYSRTVEKSLVVGSRKAGQGMNVMDHQGHAAAELGWHRKIAPLPTGNEQEIHRGFNNLEQLRQHLELTPGLLVHWPTPLSWVVSPKDPSDNLVLQWHHRYCTAPIPEQFVTSHKISVAQPLYGATSIHEVFAMPADFQWSIKFEDEKPVVLRFKKDKPRDHAYEFDSPMTLSLALNRIKYLRSHIQDDQIMIIPTTQKTMEWMPEGGHSPAGFGWKWHKAASSRHWDDQLSDAKPGDHFRLCAEGADCILWIYRERTIDAEGVEDPSGEPYIFQRTEEIHRRMAELSPFLSERGEDGRWCFATTEGAPMVLQDLKGTMLASLGFGAAMKHVSPVGQELTISRTARGQSYDVMNGRSLGHGTDFFSALPPRSDTMADHWRVGLKLQDSLGQSHPTWLGFVKLSVNLWAVEWVAEQPSSFLGLPMQGHVAYGVVSFDGKGAVASVSPSLANPVRMVPASGADPLEVTLHWEQLSQLFAPARLSAEVDGSPVMLASLQAIGTEHLDDLSGYTMHPEGYPAGGMKLMG